MDQVVFFYVNLSFFKWRTALKHCAFGGLKWSQNIDMAADPTKRGRKERKTVIFLFLSEYHRSLAIVYSHSFLSIDENNNKIGG